MMQAADLARALHAVRSGRQWKCLCVAHEDSSPSMIIFDGREQVQVRCMAGCDQLDLINALRQRGLWDGKKPDEEKLRKSVSHETAAQHREAQLQTLARRMFSDAISCARTIAQTYLERREIWPVAREIDDIRFHPLCPRANERVPALVIPLRSISSRQQVGLQRVYLTLDGRKDGKPMMLGSSRNAAMQLQPRGSVLHIAEGLESALSVIAMDHAPVWAMGSSGAIERLEVIDGVDELVIWADHDPIDPRSGTRPGQKAADACTVRWAAARRNVTVFVPDKEGDDPADVWRDRCARE
jgi:putative DNA primase/helicase